MWVITAQRAGRAGLLWVYVQGSRWRGLVGPGALCWPLLPPLIALSSAHAP